MGFKKDKKYIATAIVSLMVAGQVVNISFADSNEMINSSTNVNMNTRAVVHGQEGSFSYNGTTYIHHAEAHKDGNNFYAVTNMTSTKNVANGKMALSASVYDSGGVLVHSTAMKYNTSARSVTTRTTRSFSTSSGKRYYAGGYARVVKSDGKYGDYQIKSIASPKNMIPKEEQEERTLLYEKHNMIPALALNNKEGYISEQDLLGEAPASYEEAVASNSDDFRMIPVYDKDAKTIIGEFRIDA